MDFITLSTTPRNRTGKGSARTLRRRGRIPAILYGSDTATRMLSVEAAELEKSLQKHPASLSVFKLLLDDDDSGGRENLAMLKELQDDPLSGAILHADFYRIDMNRKVSVRVPVTTVGKSPGVELGGMLQIVRRELTVNCLPDRIPRAIEIDISELGVGDAVHVAEILLGEDVEIPHEVDFTVVTVLGKRNTEDLGDGEAEAEEGEDAAEEAEA